MNVFSARVGLGFGVSLLNIGSGMIIGLRISASMLIGGIIGWVIAPPWLLSQGLIAADARRVDILLLIMWPAVGMLVAGGMSALLLRWHVLVRTFKGLSSSGSMSGDLPLRWVWIGSLAASIFLIAVQRSSSGRRCGIPSSRSLCRFRWVLSHCACSARPTGVRSAR